MWIIDFTKYFTYHFAFKIEIKAYFARQKELNETEVQNSDELVGTINLEILKKINPIITNYEWMQSDEENRDIFNETLLKCSQNTFGKMFRKAIDDFDKAINPFIDKAIKLDDITNCPLNIKIDVNSYDSKNGKFKEDCCEMHITDLTTKNEVNYYRNPDGFSYQLMYNLGDNQYLCVLHYFSGKENCESDKGEIVAIDYFGDNMEQKIDIRFNITNCKVGKTYGDKVNATPEQIAFIYDELLKATDYASSITIENMKEKGKLKQLLPNND